MGRTTKRIGLTQRGSDEGGSTSRTSTQIENYHRNKRTFQYKKNDRGKIIKIPMLTGGQAKIAAKAPPPNKIDAKDFAVLREEKKKVKPVKAALGLALGVLGAAGAKKFMKKKSTMKPGVTSSKMPINLVEEYKKAKGLQNGGVTKANLGLMFMKKAKDKGAKGAEFLSPLAMLKRISGKKRGGGIKKDPTKTVNPFEKKSSKFMERRKAFGTLKSSLKVLGKAGKVGAIIGAVGAAGAGAAKLGQTIGRKMSEKKNKKMGGGMMKKYSSGGESSYTKGYEGRKTGKGVRESLKDKVTPMKKERLLEGLKASGKMGGGMMQKPMGYKSGTSVKVKCKLGRNKPTKIT